MPSPIRVLLVDDSVYLRHTLTRRLEDGFDIQVVGHAVDGLDALAKISDLEPDVVILDVEMPRLDGLAALERIMEECPTPVVMLSAHTQRGARTTIQALMRGAVDFVPKPGGGAGIQDTVGELAAKVKVAAGTPPPVSPFSAALRGAAPPAKTRRQPLRRGDAVVVIGTSTGGPRALQQVLSGLPADLPAAVAVVQHMPPGFTRSLARRLDEGCALTVREAGREEKLARGLILLAPGDYHLRFKPGRRMALDRGARRNHLRPAVDVTMESAAEYHGSATIGVVLTGMGSDGTAGAARIRAGGGRIVTQDRASCVVYGMPRSVVEAGLADRVVSLPEIASTLVELIG
jgi:two-component system chemotaxis response regulator CheB